MKQWMILFLSGLILVSCQEDPEPVNSGSSTFNQPFPGRQHGDQLARTLSIEVTSESYREYLKAQILKRFDGDYNFLLALHANDQMGSGKTNSEILNARLEGTTLADLLAVYPLLQIAMPELSNHNPMDWDTKGHIPLVVYRPPDVDLNALENLIGYRNGKAETISLSEEPDELILVISNNERTLAVPETTLGKKTHPLANEDCLSTVDYEGVYGGLFYILKTALETCYETNPSTGPTSDGCERDTYNGRDQIIRAKFTTMNYMREAEHYLDGNPELYFIVTLASKNPSGFASLRKSFPSKDRSQWKDCGVFSCVPEWHEYEQPVFNWDKEVFGNLVRYDWFEEDFSTAKFDITLGLTSKFEDVSVSGNVKITISKKDYFLDQDFVQFCDKARGTGTDYNTGKLYFTVNNK